MEKNKGLFSFRKHPVGDFPDGKKGRKRKGGRLRRSMGFLMAAVLIFNTLPASGLAVSASEQEKGLCEHHPEHTPECGYTEAQPCTHEHGEECYQTVTECVHEHTDECYPETEESAGEGNATASDAEGREPENCTHQCSEESGCIAKVLDCHHEHDESCGYKEAQDCGYVCEICNGIKSEDTENTEDTDTDIAKCICEILCTEDSINGDCPVCGADDASLLDCKGKVPEENMGEQEDTGICKHHQEHDADCGYIPKSEDGEGSPCTYECRICLIEVLIAALPDTVTEDNRADVCGQLDEILALYRELNEDEQGQIDLASCYELQGALDAANVPMTAEIIEGKVKTYNGSEETTSFTAGDTIKVVAALAPAGEAPADSTMFAASFIAPGAGQMAVFVGDTQVSEPVDAVDGTYTMTVSAADVLLAANGSGTGITLTAKFVENNNMADGTGTATVNITAVAVAEKDGKVIGYYGESNLDDAFTNDSATVTLLANVERTNTLNIKVNCTLDLGGHNITFTGTENVWVQGLVTAMTIRGEGEIISEQGHALVVTGSVTLEGGTFTSNGENCAGVYVNSAGASLSVTGEYVTIRNTGGGYGLAVNYAQSVQLSAGTYKGEKAVSIVSGTTTLGDLLDGGCAYHSGDTPIALEAGGKELTGTVTVKACTHTGEGVCTYAHNENTSTHTKTCLACGYTETGDCGFEKTADPTADSHTGQCPDCKRDRSGAHSFSDWAGNPVARTCTVCGYEQTAAARVEKDSTTTYVGALANAFTDENSGATVTLLTEVDLGNNYIGIRGSSTFTLDLNGQTVKASYYGAFDISDGSLTIQDSGTGGKIESSNITIAVTGGTLSIQSGTVSGLHGVQISSGTVNISGGTISGSDTGLWVSGGGNITLSGGTFSGVVAVQVDANASVTLKDLLAAGYAYHQNDIPVANAEGPGGEVPLDAKPAWLPGTVTVKECNHTGGLVPSENGYQHGGPCKCCNTALTAENHTLGADNQCSGCGAALAAKVEKSGSDTIYVEASGLEAAFAKNSGNDGATFTLLANVEPNTYLTIQINCILNLGGHTITGHIGSNQCVCVDKNTAVTILGEGEIIAPNGIALAVDGSVTLEGGTYTSTGSEDFSHGVQVSQSATLSVTGEKVTIRNTGGGSGLNVDGAQSVQLSAGTYSGAKAIESIVKLSDMLAHTDNTRYAYYQNDIPVTKASAWVDNNIGDVPLDTPIAWLSDTVTVKACNHAGEGVCTYTHNENTSTHTKTCLACGKTWDAEDCAYTFSGGTGTCAACGDSVTVTVSGTDGLIYDGTEKEPGVTVMRGETALTAGTDYTVAYTDNKNAGENKATVAVTIGNGQGNYIQNFTIGRAALTIKANDQTITYGVSIAAGTDQVTPAGLCTGDTLEGVTLSASSVNVPGGTITPSGAVIKRSGKDVTANYNINYMPGTLTINRAQGTLTVPAGPVAKIFGDGQFLLGCSTNGDGKISYASSDENVASVSADGNVLIKGAGETVITVSLAAGTNYTGAESQEVRITVAKEAAPAIPGETRNYTYLNGSHGAVTIDVAGKLPKDRGETTYTAATTDGKGILSGVSMDQDGNLVYTVEANKAIGDTAVITVTAVMANYEDTAYNVTIKLVEKKTVEPQDGGSVSVKDGCILIYGQTLSDLTLENVIFVEQGTQKQVEGTLAWNDPSHVPEVADRTAQWVFTPKDNKEYEQLTGTAAITVVKATPETEAPEAAAVTYHPAGTLGSVGLNGGGAAWTVGGSAVTVEGTWGWKEPSAIPAVKNSGYTAVFTPKDTANYDTVERTVAVTVAKAEPYIATPPTAAQITYGDALDASALTGGTVQYSSSDGTAVTGSFAWKDGSIKPDSGSAAYTVVFTPADSTDYSSVETQVTLVTGKAENAPDMPPSAMNVARRFEKVGDVGLPEGWQWQDTDRDTALEIGVPVTATAVYTGADRDNYRNVTVSVAITRADCDHEHTEIRNAVTATCQRKGYTGDTWCLDCGELLAKGTETDLADHSGGTATCIRGKVCQVCGTEYTGKDSANHMHTEIRGAIKAGCTSDGYTGDTYCTDCGAKTGSGRAVPAAGHDWHVTREEAATTTSEGRRIYTCGECGQTREESIPKLPQPSHTHSYSPRETKAATCTENGVITYSCSCGDSYTQNTAALGHSYRSGVTKQPTVSAEGVMTYTCGRCGHSYTRPIAKLPDTGTQQPGTQQPGDTEPGSGSTEETRPDTGIPFIKGEDGKTGWDVIRAEEEKAQEGSTINVDMNGTTVVPGDIFDSIRGRDITVTFDMGGGILWSVNGKEVITDKAGDIDFSVKTETNAIPVDIVNNVTGERYSIQISLAHEGEFGFTAVLSIGLGRENAGYTASLYYYNENTGELEFICSDEVAEDGTVSLAFTHASDYVIAIDGEQEEESGNAAEPAQPDTPDKDSTGASEESPQNGQAWRPWWFIVAGVLVIIVGIGVFLVVKKKQEDEKI